MWNIRHYTVEDENEENDILDLDNTDVQWGPLDFDFQEDGIGIKVEFYEMLSGNEPYDFWKFFVTDGIT